MSFATRLCAFAVILLVSMESWWNTPTDDLTPLALKQFQSDASVPQQIQQKTLAQNYGPLLWPALCWPSAWPCSGRKSNAGGRKKTFLSSQAFLETRPCCWRITHAKNLDRPDSS